MPDRLPPDPGHPGAETSERAPGPGAIPLKHHLPGLVVLTAIWAAWLLHLPQGSMASWGVSAAALAAGRLETLATHMFAHAGLLHIGFNSVVLFGLAGPLVTWMGPAPGSWLRFFAFYALAGLAGAALYLAVNPAGTIPVVGASGAISGLIGLVSRLSDEHGGLVPLFSSEMGRRIWHFVRANLWLVLLFSVPILLLGAGGGIAWEAHLGGFIAGLLGARLFLVDARR